MEAFKKPPTYSKEAHSGFHRIFAGQQPASARKHLLLIPFSQPNRSVGCASRSAQQPPPTASPAPKPVQPLDSRAVHFDHNYRLRIDGKPF